MTNRPACDELGFYVLAGQPRSSRDLLEEAIAVAFFPGQREEDVKLDRAHGHIGVRRLYAPHIDVNAPLDDERSENVVGLRI